MARHLTSRTLGHGWTTQGRATSNPWNAQAQTPANTKSSPLTQGAQTLTQHVKELRGEQPMKESEVTIGEGEVPFYNVEKGSRRSPTF